MNHDGVHEGRNTSCARHQNVLFANTCRTPADDTYAQGSVDASAANGPPCNATNCHQKLVVHYTIIRD